MSALPLGIIATCALGALILAAFSGGVAVASSASRRIRIEAATCSLASFAVALVAGVAALQLMPLVLK